MNARKVGDVLKWALVNIFIYVDVNMIIGTRETFSQAKNLLRIFIG